MSQVLYYSLKNQLSVWFVVIDDVTQWIFGYKTQICKFAYFVRRFVVQKRASQKIIIYRIFIEIAKSYISNHWNQWNRTFDCTDINFKNINQNISTRTVCGCFFYQHKKVSLLIRRNLVGFVQYLAHTLRNLFKTFLCVRVQSKSAPTSSRRDCLLFSASFHLFNLIARENQLDCWKKNPTANRL